MRSNYQPLTHKNFFNLLSFAAIILFNYGIGSARWFGTSPIPEVSKTYQTIVTPNAVGFSIWGVIFSFQAIFSVVQCLPRFRSLTMIQEGVGYWYCAISVLQIGWTFSFTYEAIDLSLVFMLLLWASLLALLYSQYYSKSDGSLMEFWLIRFPFSVHAGWITAASALNLNIVAVSMNQPAHVQLSVAIVSLAVLHAISVWVLFNIPRPNWTIACVLSWAFLWIYKELQHPYDSIQQTFRTDIVKGVACASLTVGAGVIPVQIMVRLSLLMKPLFNPYKSCVVDISSMEKKTE